MVESVSKPVMQYPLRVLIDLIDEYEQESRQCGRPAELKWVLFILNYLMGFPARAFVIPGQAREQTGEVD